MARKSVAERLLGHLLVDGMMAACPSCARLHRVFTEDKLNKIRCNDKTFVVGIEGRYLPTIN